jgi:YfiH family protein
MPFLTKDEIRYFKSEILDGSVYHAFFTRHGGFSPAPWASLNMGGTVGDEANRVKENRGLALSSLDVDQFSVFDVWQVHGIAVVIAEKPRKADEAHQQADGIVTNQSGITLMMRFADCVPILLHDPIRKVIGVAHAGWMGTVNGTVREVIGKMQSQFGSDPIDMRAVIGPSIGPDHYEVGEDVVNRVREAFGDRTSRLLTIQKNQSFLDLWAANHLLLEDAGVRHIEVVALCTACHTDDWYSHRAENGRTGRFGVIIGLV